MFRKLLPALVGPLLLVAACGSSGDALRVETGSAAAALQQAPDAAATSGSAHVELTMTMSSPAGGDDVELGGSADYDVHAKRMAMQLDLGKVVAAVAPGATDEMPAGFDQPVRFIIDDTTVYVQMPFLASFTGTSDWLSMPLDAMSEAGVGGIGGFGAGADPSAMLDYLHGAGGVTEEGHETIDGVDTTKYTATVDVQKALDEVPEAQRAELQDKIDAIGTPSLPITVWVDDDGLPRRMQMTMDAPRMGAVTITMTWSKYGEPVSIDVPDPADVTPAKDALGGLAGSFFGGS